MKSKKLLKDFTRKKQMYGRMFILPWEIGFVLFFAQPLLQSLILVFSDLDKGRSKNVKNVFESICTAGNRQVILFVSKQ